VMLTAKTHLVKVLFKLLLVVERLRAEHANHIP
jgi:hypothetical protein